MGVCKPGTPGQSFSQEGILGKTGVARGAQRGPLICLRGAYCHVTMHTPIRLSNWCDMTLKG